MAVLDLQHVGRERIGGEAVDEVALRLEESLRGGLPVRPLEMISEADKASVLLESIDAERGGQACVRTSNVRCQRQCERQPR